MGGAVRDLLLDIQPKDYDIATDAKPEEVHKLFRNSRLIGRRFRLVHVLFGREVIEVATFRGHHADNSKHGHSEEGRIVRDNVYGTIEEDAIRRDFTMNALFYDISNFEVLDYCQAVEDIDAKQVRVIGDPELRYKEDPVRMLRAIRLSVKLGLTIEPKSAEPIKKMSALLAEIPGARIWDESHKLFLAGFGLDTFKALEDYHLLATFLGMTETSLEQQDLCQPFIYAALENTDKRIQSGKSINPAFLYTCFLWWPVLSQKASYQEQGYSPAEAMQRAIAKVISNQVQQISIPKRFTQFMREVWLMQHRLESRRGKHLLKLLEHPRFRAAYDFLVLRHQVGEINNDASKWWTDIQTAKPKDKEQMIHKLRPQRRKRPRKRKPSQ